MVEQGQKENPRAYESADGMPRKPHKADSAPAYGGAGQNKGFAGAEGYAVRQNFPAGQSGEHFNRVVAHAC